jgi:hypothetical protein
MIPDNVAEAFQMDFGTDPNAPRLEAQARRRLLTLALEGLLPLEWSRLP